MLVRAATSLSYVTAISVEAVAWPCKCATRSDPVSPPARPYHKLDCATSPVFKTGPAANAALPARLPARAAASSTELPFTVLLSFICPPVQISNRMYLAAVEHRVETDGPDLAPCGILPAVTRDTPLPVTPKLSGNTPKP